MKKRVAIILTLILMFSLQMPSVVNAKEGINTHEVNLEQTASDDNIIEVLSKNGIIHAIDTVMIP